MNNWTQFLKTLEALQQAIYSWDDEIAEEDDDQLLGREAFVNAITSLISLFAACSHCKHNTDYGLFPVAFISKADLENLGFETDELDIQQFAQTIAANWNHAESSFWELIEATAEYDFGLVRKSTRQP